MQEFLQDYPKIGAAIIALVSSIFGFSLKTLLNYFFEIKRKKAELREFFWKEKINAAKKAAEYYYESLSQNKLVIQKIEMEFNEKEYSPMISNMIKERVNLLSQRIANPTNFEHHHIKMFYDINEEKINSINKESFTLVQDLGTIKFMETDSNEQTEKKRKEYTEIQLKLKKNLENTSMLFESHLKTIRNDIKKFVN